MIWRNSIFTPEDKGMKVTNNMKKKEGTYKGGHC